MRNADPDTNARACPPPPPLSIPPAEGPSVSGRQTEQTETCQSFDALVATYEKRIFNLIYRILGDYDEAADVTQETFISAYRAFDRFRGDAKVYTWLYQIALNHCRNRLRRRGRSRSVQIESLDQPRNWEDEEEGGREVADLSTAPQVVLEDKELRGRGGLP